ncbi:Uncharacterized protein TCM_039649 [Theobroma cacao]|uniref:Uncharacterized protein n=1 Tax=Theobroma cacao TaxID=3641 RepID=A0A061GRV5_THECC|nr:Uncharacterized protein TCM_039649 [Theobroma cacao]
MCLRQAQFKFWKACKRSFWFKINIHALKHDLKCLKKEKNKQSYWIKINIHALKLDPKFETKKKQGSIEDRH